MNFKEIFANQIASVESCDGDFLNGKTFAEAVDFFSTVLGVSISTHDPKLEADLFKNDIVYYIADKIVEHFIHKNEYVGCVTIREENDRGFRIVHKVWESDWDDFLTKYKPIDMTKKFPLFEKIDIE